MSGEEQYPDTYEPSLEELKARRSRSLAIGGALILFVILVFGFVIVRMGAM